MAAYTTTTNGNFVVKLLPDDEIKHDENDDEKMTETDDDDEDEKRWTWTSKREYLLSAIGFCVALGNVWRFPYMCQRNGGGAFLIPFFASLILCGLPLYFLEAAVGQFTGRSAVHVWNVCPLLKGVGVGMVVVALICFWYYNTIMAWALYYLVSSCQQVLPWSRCDGWWNTPRCFSYTQNTDSSQTNGNYTVLGNNMTGNWSEVPYANDGTGTSYINGNLTSFPANVTDDDTYVSAAEEFWQHNVLQLSNGISKPGHVVWPLAVALVVTLVFTFFALIKGIKSTGKVVYVTATLPYVLLTVLLVRGATLPGAKDGIIFYLKPDFSRLKDPEVWVEAALQVFYSLGPGWGGIITMASYNKFKNNCLRDSVILTFVCEGTSIYGGFAIFSVLGYMAHMSGVPIQNVVSSGPGLAFIVYPEAISLLPLPQLWAVLFFIMIVTLAIDSQLTIAETFLTTLCDYFPRAIGRHRMLVTALFCAFFIPTGLVFVTQGGVYVFQLVDWFLAAFSLFVFGLLECVGLAWVYGADRFGQDIQMMIGRRPPLFFKILWCFVTPICVGVLLCFTLAKYQLPAYGPYQYETWAVVIGWFIAFSSFLPIPIVAVWRLYQTKGSLLQRLRETTKPNEEWGPPGLRQRCQYQKQLLQRPSRDSCLDIVRN